MSHPPPRDQGATSAAPGLVTDTIGRMRGYFRANVQQTEGGISQVVGFVAAWMAFALILFVMPLPDGMTAAGKATLAVVVWACLMWITEAVPVAVTGLAIPMMLIMAGAFTMPKQALSGFTQHEVFLALAAFIFAAAMHLTGLDRKLAGGILSKLRVKTATGASTGMFLTNCVLAFIIPAAVARAATLLPVVTGMREFLGKSEDGARATKGIVIMSLVYWPMISGLFLLTAHFPNLIIVNAIANDVGVQIGYGQWFALNWIYLLMFPPILLWSSWLFKTRRARFEVVSSAARSDDSLEESSTPNAVDDRPKDRPGLTGEQRAVLIVFVIVAAGWAFLSGVKPGIVGLFGVLLLFTPGLLRLDWKKVQANTMWGAFLLLGGALSMTLAMGETGLGEYLASLAAPLALGQGWLVIIVIFMVLTQVIRLGMLSNVAAVALLAPILIPLAVELGLNPIAFTMLIANIDTFAFVLPTQITAAVVAYGTGTFTMRDYAKSGVVAIGIAMVFTLLVAVPWYAMMGVPVWSPNSLEIGF
ncbi:MAG: sodium:cation symporter [Actinobacteria bacterium]|nr:sodium:cation symporter [Actinomycetota bacterium]